MQQLTAAIQESLVALLCYDTDKLGAKAAAALVEPKQYDPFWREIAGAASAYLVKYGKPPGDHTLDIIGALKARKPDSAAIYDRLYSSLEQTRAGINREYVLAQAGKFCRHQRLKAAIQKSLELLGQERDSALDEAEAAILSIKQARLMDGGEGLLLNDAKQALAFMDSKDEYFETGIPELDKEDLGPVRGGAHLFIALPGRGKTWWFVHNGKMGLLAGRRVVHITCEMSAARMAQRYLQAFFSVTKRKQEVTARTFEKDTLSRFIGMQEIVLRKRPALADEFAKQYLGKKIKQTFTKAPPLYIKQFPTGALTVPMLTAYLDQLEALRGVIPDLLIVDYPDLMAISSNNYRHDVDRLYKELRGIAVERNLALAIASQSNKEGLKAKAVGEGNAAEGFSKNNHADTVITYSQTDEEYALGLARLTNTKARDGVKGTQVLLSQAYGMGQFYYDSVRMTNPRIYWDNIKSASDMDGEDEEETG